MSQHHSILTEEELSLVNDCAARLRVIQGDAAAIDAVKRREYLSEEVSHSFKVLPAVRRKPCLEALLTRFPVSGQVARRTTPPPVSVVEAVPDTPAVLVEKLAALAGELPADQLAEFAKILADAGLAEAKKTAGEPGIAPLLEGRFGVPKGQPISPERVVEMAALLVQLMGDLDRTAFNVLRELYPRSTALNRPLDFRKASRQFLTGELDDFEPHLRLTSALLLIMVGSPLGGGRDFSRQFLDKFKPDSIDEVVGAEGGYGGMLKPSKRECCWNKYRELFKDIGTPDQLERWVKDCLGKFIDSGLKNIR